MSTNQFRMVDCERKVRYPSEHQAQGAATRLGIKHSKKLIPYVCKLCGDWHLRTDRSGV